jgi:hypothetical protein
MSDDETLFNFGYGATYTTFNFSFATSGSAGVPWTVGVAVSICAPTGRVVVNAASIQRVSCHRAHTISYRNWLRDFLLLGVVVWW